MLDLLVRCVGVGFVGLTGFAGVWFVRLLAWLGYSGFLVLLLLVYCGCACVGGMICGFR